MRTCVPSDLLREFLFGFSSVDRVMGVIVLFFGTFVNPLLPAHPDYPDHHPRLVGGVTTVTTRTYIDSARKIEGIAEGWKPFILRLRYRIGSQPLRRFVRIPGEFGRASRIWCVLHAVLSHMGVLRLGSR